MLGLVRAGPRATLCAQGRGLMRWLLLSTVMIGCGGAAEEAPDALFEVTVTNVAEACSSTTELVSALKAVWPLNLDDIWPVDNGAGDSNCPCEDIDGSDCSEEVERKVEQFTYALFQDGEAAVLKIGDEAFASGSLLGCVLDYESPVWLDSLDDGEVQWQVKSVHVIADINGTCEEKFEDGADKYDFLGIEQIEVIGGEHPDYPAGRTAWKIISGKRISG